jgi:hypothetical protein
MPVSDKDHRGVAVARVRMWPLGRRLGVTVRFRRGQLEVRLQNLPALHHA